MCAIFIIMKNVVYQIQIGPYKQIGSTNNLKRRMAEHLNALKKDKHKNEFMQNVYTKYQDFSYSILKAFETRKQAYDYEQQLLLEYSGKPYFLMLSNAATGFALGNFHPNKKLEFRKAQSKRLSLNNPMKDPATAKKKGDTSRKLWKENPKDISYLYTKEVCEKRKKSLKKYYSENPKNQVGANNPNAKKLLNVITGEIYATGKDAGKAFGLKSARISALAKEGKKLRFI
ncbi:MAG: hypothetical protein FJX18_07110 [Alphaproteobacteria bacterium]|nr:hypothetical protein [Alphaproteobacteria bacterium]